MEQDKDKNYPLLGHVDMKEYDGVELVKVPQHFTTYKYLTKQFFNIVKHLGLNQTNVKDRTGISTPVQYRLANNLTTPSPLTLERMERFIDEYNEGVVKEFRIDVTRLCPEYGNKEPLTDWHYFIIRTLEDIYGSMDQCPDNHVMLKELQNSWSK